MPEKNNVKKPQTKTDFVRTQGNAPAKDVVAKAAKLGMKLTEKYVYVLRSQAKKKANGSGKRARGNTRATGGARDEAGLRRAIAELGLTKARQVLEEVESAFGA